MVRFLAISGAAIVALGLAGATPALLRQVPPSVAALVMPPAEPAGRPCEDGQHPPEGCPAPLAWLDDGWALLSDQPGRAELRADGRRARPPARL